MSLKQKAIAYFRKKPEAPASAFAKLYGVSTSYAHKLKVYAIDCIAEDYDTRPDVIIERGWTVTTTSDGQMIGSIGNVSTPLDTQVAGSHYKGKKIQPVEYIHANKLNFLEGCIVKRITRWREKDGFQDLEKIKHEVDLLIEMEKKYANGN
jgi:hypothetical protein